MPEVVRESYRIAERLAAPQPAGGGARQPNGFAHSSSSAAFPPPGRPPGSPDKPPRHSAKRAPHPLSTDGPHSPRMF